jgi:hypothetical protein
MPKNKRTRPIDATVNHIKAIQRDASAASKAIESLCAKLPDQAAVEALDEIGARIVEQFCEQLGKTGEQERMGKVDAFNCMSRDLGSDLLYYARLIFDALIEYATKNPQEASLIAQSEEWPVILSTDPAWDIRRVVQNKIGPASTRYAPILKWLGKATFWGDLTIKGKRGPFKEDPGPFHEIAGTAADSVSRWLGIGHTPRLREQLPWIFDYPDGEKPYALTMPDLGKDPMFDVRTDPRKLPRFGDRRAWVIAVKYYLYLTLAPKPQRSNIRKLWRNRREEAFAKIVPRTPAESALHKNLAKKPALPPPTDLCLELYCFPSAYAAECDLESGKFANAALQAERASWDPDDWDDQKRSPGEPEWATWWRAYLQYQPEALFGNADSLIDSKDPAVVTKMLKQRGPGRVMSGFKKCIDPVLDAFLRLAGCTGGLKQIQNLSDPLPEIALK